MLKRHCTLSSILYLKITPHSLVNLIRRTHMFRLGINKRALPITTTKITERLTLNTGLVDASS